MAKGAKAAAYTAALTKRFGSNLMLGKYRGRDIAIAHKCVGCGKTFNRSPRVMLSSAGKCQACMYAGGQQQAEWIARVIKKFDRVLPIRIEAKGRRYLCKVCNKQFVAAHNWAAATKFDSCPKCKAPPAKYRSGRLPTNCIRGKIAAARDGDSIAFTTDKIVRHYVPSAMVNGAPICAVSVNKLYSEWDKFVSLAKAGKKKKLRVFVVKGRNAYELPEGWSRSGFDWVAGIIRRVERPTMTILSLDPGTSNCAWACLNVEYGKLPVVRGSGKINSTVKSMVGSEHRMQVLSFLNEIESLGQEFGASAWAAERFMYRMGLNGTTMEAVNAMIGAFMVRTKEPTVVFPASQWKNAFNAKFNLEDVYKQTDQEPHVIDAMLIGVYASELYYSLPHYQFTKATLNKLLKAISRKGRK